MSYVSGDFGDAGTYERVAAAIGDATVPGVLSRDPAVPVRPRDQGPDRRGPDQDRAGRRREAVRARSRVGPRAARPRSTSTSTSRSSTGSTTSWARWGSARSSTSGSRTPMLEPVWNRNHVARGPDHDGRELRRRGPRPLLRPGRRAARRGRQPHDAGGRRRRDGGPGRRTTPSTLKDAMFALFRAMPAADPAHYVRGQYDGYRDDRRGRVRTRRPRRMPRCGSRSTTGVGPACRCSSVPGSACRSPRPSCGSCSTVRRASASCRRSRTAHRSRASS